MNTWKSTSCFKINDRMNEWMNEKKHGTLPQLTFIDIVELADGIGI